MMDCKPAKRPAEPNAKLMARQEGDEQIDTSIYRSLIGSLLYLGKQTRPDILNTVNILSRFQEPPGRDHWNAGKHLLRYSGTLFLPRKQQ